MCSVMETVSHVMALMGTLGDVGNLYCRAVISTSLQWAGPILDAQNALHTVIHGCSRFKQVRYLST